jgi:HAD superfamily hydrolase (TIGR01459 family)
MKIINGISEVYLNYDYFIIDLWGVLHDGHAPYKGAIEALKNLKQNNKKIALLSNAPRRAIKAEQVLENLGFKKDFYHLLITSGEVTYNYVKNNDVGKNYLYIGPQKDRHLLDGIGFKEVEQASKADFAIATGFEDFGSVFEEKKHFLDDALKHNLPLLVANPDRLVVKQTGEVYICAGLMGEYYSENGGKIIPFGKPYRNAYEGCLKFFDTSETNRILCIGDSLHTDVGGANNIGASSLFIAGGIHKKDVIRDGLVDVNQLQKLIDKENEKPSFAADEFRW